MAGHKYIARPGKEHFRYVGVDPCPCGEGQIINVLIGEMTQEQMQAWFDHSPAFSRRYVMKVRDNDPDAPPPRPPDEEEESSEKKPKTRRKKKSKDE